MDPSPSDQDFDLSRALTFMFDDPDWVPKFVIGSMLAVLTPAIIGWVFLVGYAVLIAKHRMRRDDTLLPEWDDLPGVAIDGLRGAAIWIAHKFPLIVLSVLMVFALAGSAFWLREGASVPEELFYYGIPIFFVGGFLILILTIVLLIYTPAAYVRFVQQDRLGAAFDVVDNVAFMRERASTYFVALVTILLAAIISQFGIFLFCVGIFPAIFWSSCVFGYSVGELARLEGGPTDAGV